MKDIKGQDQVTLSARLDSAFSVESYVAFFHFFFFPLTSCVCFRPGNNYHCSSTIAVLIMYCSSTVHVFKNIKNGSHDTIHTFKNYFATVFSVFSFSNNKFNPNGPLM